MYPFSEIFYVPGAEINNSPARCNRKTKQLWINNDLWPTLSENTQLFIMYHEAGHIILQTTDEFSADEYAFQRMVHEGKSLKDCVHALTSLLSGSDGHRHRAYLTLQRAKAVDELSKQLTMQLDHFSDFGSKKKREARQERKKEKRENKSERRRIKTDKKRAKVEGKRSRHYRGEVRADAVMVKNEGQADAKTILAEQGIAQGTEAGGILKGAAGLFTKKDDNTNAMQEMANPTLQAGGMGSGTPAAMNQQFAPEDNAPTRRSSNNDEEDIVYPKDPASPEPKPKSNMMYIIGAIVVVVIIAAVFIFKKK